MSARNLVELIANAAAVQTGSEFAVCQQQAFQRPASQIKIRNFCVINRFYKSEWIVLPTGITAVRPKKPVEATRLLKPTPRKPPPGYVNGGTEPADKRKSIRMTQP